MKTKVLTLLTLMLLFTINGFAQEKNTRFGIELNGGFSLPVSEPAGAALNVGFGFEGLLHYRIMPHVGLYGGWGWNRFAAEHSFAGNDVCLEETGYIAGLQFMHPVGGTSVSYFLRAGALFNHIETENADGDIINDTDHGIGWQLAGGIAIPLSEKWMINPGVKFNALKRDTEYEGMSYEMKYQYLALRIGFTRTF